MTDKEKKKNYRNFNQTVYCTTKESGIDKKKKRKEKRENKIPRKTSFYGQ